MTAETEQQAKWKQPDDVCACMKRLEEKELIRWGLTGDMVTLAPVIDPLRNRKNAPFVFVQHCPNCGAANFDMTEEALPAPLTPQKQQEYDRASEQG